MAHTSSGRLHPLSSAIRDIATSFGRMGFSVAYGPELEDEHYNFNMLNIPAVSYTHLTLPTNREV